MRRSLLALFIAALICAVYTVPARASDSAAACRAWPAWDEFRGRFMNAGGRIIDPSLPGGQTTSEGQSYGLFFALVANDRDSFDRILKWTEDNLAEGDLTARLPAWLWGKRDDDSWGVLDQNPASDSDLWIAYALGEAARLWKQPRYAALGQLLAARVLREETVDIPGMGRTLLPAPKGFEPEPGVYRLNPSYVPIQLMRRFSVLYPEPAWRRLVTTSVEIITRSSPRGFAPEWILFRSNGGFMADPQTKGIGSYNAIRVYLWAGMLAEQDPARPVLLRTFAPAARHVAQTGTPPLEANTRDGSTKGVGPAGFSAAMMPLLSAAKMPEAARQQRLRVDARAPLEKRDNYYEQVLVLFGAGWMDGQYRFAADGALQPNWKCAAR